MRRFALPLLLLATLPAPIAADSDGWFCAGPDYVAWDIRDSDGAPGHRLHIVRFSEARGIERVEPIPLPDFQVHGMTCERAAVELHGWDTRWRVDLTDPARPAITTRAATPDPAAAAANLNLGHWARPGVLVLDDAFQLVIARVSRPVPGGIEHFTVTELVRRESDGSGLRIVEARTLFRGIFLETVD